MISGVGNGACVGIGAWVGTGSAVGMGDVGAGAGVAGGAACVTVGCAAGGLPGGTTSTPAQGVKFGAGALYGSSVISKQPQPGQPQPQLLPTVLPGCQSGGSNSNSASNSRQATLIVAPRLARGIVRP